ncbi:MAG: amidohydrolase family protein [Acidobacteria bacterium]|nr:amidohydrolase family protein [Acidobacteriota bacterium]
MPIRMAAFFETHRMPFFPEVIRTTYRRTGTFWNFGDDKLWFAGVASERWDAEQTDSCLGPDVDAPPEIKAQERCPAPDGLMWAVLKEATKAGWRVAGVHGVGSHGVRLFTQMLEEAMKEANLSVEDIRELRPTLEHGSVVGTLPDVVAKLKQYNIILSLGPRYLRDGPLYLKDYGPKIIPFILPYKSLIDAGVRVVGQADSAEPHTLGVFYFIWLVTSRQLGDTVIPPEEERVDRVTALKMWTRWAAEYVYKEEVLGSLEKGKFADFVVLDRDYFTIPQAQIPKVRPLLTVLGGEVVFLHREFARELGTGPVGFQPPPGWPQDAGNR